MNASFVARTNSKITDPSPPIDGQACYKVAVTRNGDSAATDEACVLTPDGRYRPLWRATLRVRVADVSDAGTDSAVHVRLNSPTGIGFSPSGNETWIDTPLDDFEANTSRDYELLLNHVRNDVSEVKMIALLVDGDDALCIRSVELFLNERSMFAQDFGTAGVWVSEGNQLTVRREQLRGSTAWQTAGSIPRPAIVRYSVMDIVATAAVGHALHGRDVSFWPTFTLNNPKATTTSGSRRVYEWAIEADGLPLKLQAELLTERICKDGQATGRVSVGQVDADSASWFYLLVPLSEVLVELFEPEFPSLFSAVGLDLGSCTDEINLCFGETGMELTIGSCAP